MSSASYSDCHQLYSQGYVNPNLNDNGFTSRENTNIKFWKKLIGYIKMLGK